MKPAGPTCAELWSPECRRSYIKSNLVIVEASREGSGWTCQVAVEQGGKRTEHTVTVSPASLARWGGGRERQEDVEDLVRRSFEFLLEREPATSILRRFDLSVIESYFPEYDEMFRSGPG